MRDDITFALAINAIGIVAMRGKKQAFTTPKISECKQLSREHKERKRTFAAFSSGGCLDSIAAIATGFAPIWGTEVCERKRTMWANLTGTPDLGDTFHIDYANVESPNMLIAGQTCVDYSSSGPKTGADGDTGWMFVKQADPILSLQPESFCLEMVANAIRIHGGKEVRQLVDKLRSKYVVKYKVIRTIDHGDATNRTRLFIVGFHRKLGAAAHAFNWPKGTAQNYPTARDIAEPDSAVPDEYKRYNPDLEYLPGFYRDAIPGLLHKIAQLAPGMGHSSNPHAIYSWDGILNCQTTHNGGGMRPMLSWQHGTTIQDTRLTLPVEAVRAASLHEPYLDWVRSMDNDDKFLFQCVNMGVPINTARDIYEEMSRTLIVAGVKGKIPHVSACKTCSSGDWAPSESIAKMSDCPMVCDGEIMGSHAMRAQSVSSIMVDTGCNYTLGKTKHNANLQNKKKSKVVIEMATEDASTKADYQGTLPVYALNTTDQEGFPSEAPLNVDMITVPDIREELFSVDGYYRDQGYDISLHQPPKPCGMHKGNHKIPFRYDWEGSGFYMDYITIPKRHTPDGIDGVRERKQAYAAILKDEHDVRAGDCNKDNANMARCHCYSNTVAQHVHDKACNHPMVTDVINATDVPQLDMRKLPELNKDVESVQESFLAQHPNDREFRGVREGLRKKKRDLSYRTFHEEHGHIGECPGCDICKMVKGDMRRITRKVDKVKERRVGFAWDMDMITFSDRSFEKHKYAIVIKDRSYSGFYKLIPLRLKSEATAKIREWVESLRSDPLYRCFNHQMVSHIKTDHDGAWDDDNAEYQAMIKELGIKMEYISPDRHEENGRAEKACDIVECIVKSLLMQNNLSPLWWTRALADAEFLLNRFPLLSLDVNTPLDHDRWRPIEIFTDRAFISDYFYSFTHECSTTAIAVVPFLPFLHKNAAAPPLR